jgi:hypothetical protein
MMGCTMGLFVLSYTYFWIKSIDATSYW